MEYYAARFRGFRLSKINYYMEGKAKELAEFIRTIGLNSKFLDDRRKEV